MKKVRTVFAAVMALCICFAMAGCGKSGSSDEITIDNIDEKFENMSDDEIEQAIVEGLEELDEGNGKISETAETENAAPAEIVF